MTSRFKAPRSVSTALSWAIIMCLLAITGGLQACGSSAPSLPALSSITVSPAGSSIAAGASQAYVATGNYSNGTTADLSATVTWSSSNPAVATISTAGVATAVTVGSTTITAMIGVTSGPVRLTVTAAVVTALTVTPSNASVESGFDQAYTATAVYTDKSTRDVSTSVTWTSSDPSVASISNTAGSRGVATALTSGTANVTATLANVSASAGLVVTPAVVVFAYVANAADSTLSLFLLHINSGVLTPNGTMSTALEPRAVVADESGSFLYVLTASDNDVRGYAVNSDTGALTAIASPNPVGSGGSAMRMVSTCAFVLTANAVTSFTRNTQSGVLTPTNPATVPTGNSPSDLQYINNNVLVTNYTDDTLEVYTVGSDCTLTAPTQTAATGAGPAALAAYDIGHGNARVVVVNTMDDTLSLYGTYSPPSAPGNTAAVGHSPSAIAMSHNNFVYVTNQIDDTVSSFATASSTIALTPIGAPVATGRGPAAIAINTYLPYAYVTNVGANSVSMYRIDSTTGALTTIAAPVPTGKIPLSIALAVPSFRLY